MDYDQKQVDEEFKALIARTRESGLAETADHFAKAQGMERINAIRFLSAMFMEHEKQRRIKAALIAVVWIAVLIVFAIAEGRINVQ
ncbi:MAG: hypothetical protein QY332_10505 [Anaerolineales bacterium]|nr:MAG: hypothetical protein QY332_10505 [Anaerolineales bacterium]